MQFFLDYFNVAATGGAAIMRVWKTKIKLSIKNVIF